MKVSVITVVYNNVETIGSAIDAVLNQTYPDIEYIIVDGGSTDGTLKKIESYGKKIDLLISEPDQGIYDAMNKGLSMVTGDIVAFLNSDDFYSSTHVIEKVVSEFKRQEIDGVFGDLHYVHADDTARVFRRWVSGTYKVGSFLYGWMPPHPTFFVKKSVYDRYGGFNTTFKSAADYELMLRFVHVNKIKISYVPEVLVKMRTGGVSNSSLKNRLRANLEDREAWEINGVKPYFFTLFLKPLRKVKQFLNSPADKVQGEEVKALEVVLPLQEKEA
jgi:glycosyltransferase involved in cell wall biosynthesis